MEATPTLLQLLASHARDRHDATGCGKVMAAFAVPVTKVLCALHHASWDAQREGVPLTDKAAQETAGAADILCILASTSHCAYSHRGLDDGGRGAAQVRPTSRPNIVRQVPCAVLRTR